MTDQGNGGEPGDFGEFAPDAEEAPDAAPTEGAAGVPVEKWIVHPVSDSSDYLDRPMPQYEDIDEEGNEIAAEPAAEEEGS